MSATLVCSNRLTTSPWCAWPDRTIGEIGEFDAETAFSCPRQENGHRRPKGTAMALGDGTQRRDPGRILDRYRPVALAAVAIAVVALVFPGAEPAEQQASAGAAALPSSIAARSEEHTSELQSPCNLVC